MFLPRFFAASREKLSHGSPAAVRHPAVKNFFGVGMAHNAHRCGAGYAGGCVRPSVALFRVRFRLNKGAFSAAFRVVAAVFCAVVAGLKWRCGSGSTRGRVCLHEPHPPTHDFAAKFLLGVRSEGVHLWAANGGSARSRVRARAAVVLHAYQNTPLSRRYQGVQRLFYIACSKVIQGYKPERTAYLVV